jgi:hypothetical protein
MLENCDTRYCIKLPISVRQPGVNITDCQVDPGIQPGSPPGHAIGRDVNPEQPVETEEIRFEQITIATPYVQQ